MSCTVIIKDKNLKPENIKKDVTILKVKGTFEGGSEPVLQSKTVNSSTASQSVTYDNGYDGLSSVTVNPYRVGSIDITSKLGYTYYYSSSTTGITPSGAGMIVNGFDYVYWHSPKATSKTVNPSTSQQTFNPLNEQVQFYNGITVNAVDASIDSNIQAGNIKKNVTILGVTGTLESGGSDLVIEAKAGNISDLSSLEMYAPSRNYQYYNLFKRCEIDKLPDMSGWTSISGTCSCEDMFRDASSDSSGDKIADLSSLTTLSGSTSVKNMFNGSKITELRLPNLSSIGTSSGLELIVGQTEATTLKTLKINALVCQPYGMTGALTGREEVAGVENIEITGMANQSLSFSHMANLTADSVLNILTHLGTPLTKKNVSFISSGLTVTDYPDGRIQAALDAAKDKWNIYNLTITPYS